MAKKKENNKKKNNKKEKPSEKQPTKNKKISKEEKQLRNFFIILGIVALLIWGFYYVTNHSPEFEYKEVKFQTVKQGDLLFYKTLVPLYNQKGEIATKYRFYLRNHPEDIKDIPIPEKLELKRLVILNYSDNIVCNGDTNIALANFQQVYSVMGAKIWRASNLNESYKKCDEQGRYNYINIKRGNKTEIKEIGPSCYELTFKDCEILDVTERYILKMFVQTKDKKIPYTNLK